MTQKQKEKHEADWVALHAQPKFFPVPLDMERTFAAPDYQWALKKQRATCLGSTKNTPGPTPLYWGKPKPEPVPENIKEFVDKHVINLLSKEEQGREFLQQLKDKANYHYEVEVPVEVPDEPTPTA